jgi:hypothetical protein
MILDLKCGEQESLLRGVKEIFEALDWPGCVETSEEMVVVEKENGTWDCSLQFQVMD